MELYSLPDGEYCTELELVEYKRELMFKNVKHIVSVGFLITFFSLALWGSIEKDRKPVIFLSPLDKVATEALAMESTKSADIVPVEYVNNNTLYGGATWYGTGEDECIECGKHYDENGKLFYRMANGQILDDKAHTVACRMGKGNSCDQFPVGSTVEIENLDNNMVVIAKVTDVGGLRDGILLDLTKGTRDALNGDRTLKNIKVTKIK